MIIFSDLVLECRQISLYKNSNFHHGQIHERKKNHHCRFKPSWSQILLCIFFKVDFVFPRNKKLRNSSPTPVPDEYFTSIYKGYKTWQFDHQQKIHRTCSLKCYYTDRKHVIISSVSIMSNAVIVKVDCMYIMR